MAPPPGAVPWYPSVNCVWTKSRKEDMTNITYPGSSHIYTDAKEAKNDFIDEKAQQEAEHAMGEVDDDN